MPTRTLTIWSLSEVQPVRRNKIPNKTIVHKFLLIFFRLQFVISAAVAILLGTYRVGESYKVFTLLRKDPFFFWNQQVDLPRHVLPMGKYHEERKHRVRRKYIPKSSTILTALSFFTRPSEDFHSGEWKMSHSRLTIFTRPCEKKQHGLCTKSKCSSEKRKALRKKTSTFADDLRGCLTHQAENRPQRTDPGNAGVVI